MTKDLKHRLSDLWSMQQKIQERKKQMASFEYKGNTYFYFKGKWMDAQSRAVRPEMAEELEKFYSEEAIKAREQRQHQKKKARPRNTPAKAELTEEQKRALAGEPVTYTAEIKGNVQASDKMTDDELTLKVGMQVMTLVNDAQEEKLEKIVLGNFKQIPIKIAYAITIHKSQGQTYSSVNISPDCFADGQLYVALSRARSVENMSLDHAIRPRALRTSRSVKLFYDGLKE